MTIGFVEDSGETRWIRYSESEKIEGVNLHDFLGIVGVNEHILSLSSEEKVDSTFLANWPWIGAYYGPGESFSLISIPADDFVSQEWRSTYGVLLKDRLESLCLSIEYESIAGDTFLSGSDSQRCERLELSPEHRVN